MNNLAFFNQRGIYMKLHYIITSALLLIAGFVQAAQGNKKQKTEGEQQGQTRQVHAPQQLTHEEQVMRNAGQVRDQELKRLAGIKRKNIDKALVNDSWLAEVTTITIPELQKLIREYYINPIEYLSLVYPSSNVVQEELDHYFKNDHYESKLKSLVMLNDSVNGASGDIQVNKSGMLWHSFHLYNKDHSKKVNFLTNDETLKFVSTEGGKPLAKSILRNDNKIILICSCPEDAFCEARILNPDGSLYKQLHRHDEFISCIATNNDNITVTGSYDNTVKVWAANGTLLKTLDAYDETRPQYQVNAVAISDDGVIICGRKDGMLYAWRPDATQHYKLKHPITNERQCPITTIVAYSGDKFITMGSDYRDKQKKSLVLWTFNKHEQATPKYDGIVLPHDTYDAAFGSDGKLATAGWKDGKNEISILAIWNIDNSQSPQCLRSFEINGKAYGIKITHDNSIMCTNTDARSSFILLLGFDGTITRYELEAKSINYNIGIDSSLYAAIDEIRLIALKPDSAILSHVHNLSFEQLATLRLLLQELCTHRVLSPQQKATILSLWEKLDRWKTLETSHLPLLKNLFSILNDLRTRNIVKISPQQNDLLHSLNQRLQEQASGFTSFFRIDAVERSQREQFHHEQCKALHSLLTNLLNMRRYVFSQQQINLLLSLPQPLQKAICQRFGIAARDLERLRKQTHKSQESKQQKQQ